MKQNRLLVGILSVGLSVSAVFAGGYAYAKYLKDDSANDAARVANFGVTATGTGKTFSTSYTVDGETITSSDGTNIIAPGTSGSLAEISLSGTPEVAVQVSYDVDLDLNGWTVDGEFYCPIVFYIGNNSVIGMNYSSAETLSAAVKAEVAKIVEQYEPNTDLSTVKTGFYIEWQWNADDYTRFLEPEMQPSDATKNQALATQAENGSPSTISLSVDVVTQQIDKYTMKWVTLQSYDKSSTYEVKLVDGLTFAEISKNYDANLTVRSWLSRSTLDEMSGILVGDRDYPTGALVYEDGTLVQSSDVCDVNTTYMLLENYQA